MCHCAVGAICFWVKLFRSKLGNRVRDVMISYRSQNGEMYGNDDDRVYRNDVRSRGKCSWNLKAEKNCVFRFFFSRCVKSYYSVDEVGFESVSFCFFFSTVLSICVSLVLCFSSILFFVLFTNRYHNDIWRTRRFVLSFFKVNRGQWCRENCQGSECAKRKYFKEVGLPPHEIVLLFYKYFGSFFF